MNLEKMSFWPKVHITQGNILDIEEGIICHQVDSSYRNLSELSRKMIKKWPAIDREASIQALNLPPKLCMGEVLFTPIDSKLTIATIFGQWPHLDRPDFSSIDRAFRRIIIHRDTGRIVYVPLYLGCEQDNGLWPAYLAIVVRYIPDVVIVSKHEVMTL